MEYKKTDDPQSPHSFTFVEWEVDTLQAAYAEANVTEEQHGNSGHIGGHEGYIILSPEEQEEKKYKKSLHLRFASLGNLIEILENFAEQTDAEAIEIANLPLPKFENIYVAKRRDLGAKALELSAEIRKIQEAEEPAKPDEEIVQEFSEQLEQLDRGLPEF